MPKHYLLGNLHFKGLTIATVIHPIYFWWDAVLEGPGNRVRKYVHRHPGDQIGKELEQQGIKTARRWQAGIIFTE